MASMPRESREVFVLRDLEKLDLGVVAELLGIPRATAWDRLHRAYQEIDRSKNL
jgi:DNA-directed RNA polymerase specialized sigma24 family protein